MNSFNKYKRYLVPLILTVVLFTTASLFFTPLDAPAETGGAGTQLILEGGDYYTGYPLYYLKRMTYFGDSWWRTMWRYEYLALDIVLAGAVSLAICMLCTKSKDSK